MEAATGGRSQDSRLRKEETIWALPSGDAMTESDVARWLVQFDPDAFEHWCGEQGFALDSGDETIVRQWAASLLAPTGSGVTVPAEATDGAHR